MHLIMDGHAENTALMMDKAKLRQWLINTVRIAGMTPFGEAYIYGFPWPGSRDWTALTGFQPLMESGLSVHCWPERKFVFIDLFSCSEFKEKKVIKFIARAFQMKEPKIIVLDRGIDPGTGEIVSARVRS